MILVDTNVLIDVWENDPQWAAWSQAQLRAQAQVHALAVNPVIYAELALAYNSVEALDRALKDLDIWVEELPRPALFLAGKAFVQYRRRVGQGGGVLSDFFIGAHAAVRNWPILTRDTRRYESYFPTVKLIFPKPTSGHNNPKSGVL